MKFAMVAVKAPMKDLLIYSIPDEMTHLTTGHVVIVPLGRRTSMGIVFRLEENIPVNENNPIEISAIKTILEIKAEYPADAIKNLIPWIQWISNYYFYPIGLVACMIFPPLEKKSKISVRKKSPIPEGLIENAFEMNEEQKKVFQSILYDINNSSRFLPHLIYGVTGSGKTEIYLQLFEHILAQGKNGMFLLPEISLTPQLVNRFAKRFGNQIALLHSQLTDRERTQFWWEMVENKKRILIGARSALFCPVPNLGLIVVDEEHENSFKQDDKLKYHGRDLAIMLGHFSKCPVILGSATPSLESWNNALSGKYQLHQLKHRVGKAQLPQIEIIDIKSSNESKKNKGLPFWMSEKLFCSINHYLENKNQIALFLNRRGMSQSIICPSCGYTKDCPNCDIKLSLHAHAHLVCHFCDYHENFKKKCPDCIEGELEILGIGTETVEIEIKKLFPNSRVARVDRDEIQNRLDMENIVEKMEKNEIDILIGTQMIAKGLDFPNLMLVGLILVDIGLSMPDFRASERNFQLITQMSGRAGRNVETIKNSELQRGKVILQTFNPDNEVIQFALDSNYERFATFDLTHRKTFSYPPYGQMIALRIQSKKLDKAIEVSKVLSCRSESLKSNFAEYSEIEILGPTSSPIAKIRNEFRFQMLLKAPKKNFLHNFIMQLLHNEKWIPSSVKISIDVDPQNML